MRKEQYRVSYDLMFNVSYITSQKNNMLGFMLISPAQRLATDQFATTILSFSFNIRATWTNYVRGELTYMANLHGGEMTNSPSFTVQALKQAQSSQAVRK